MRTHPRRYVDETESIVLDHKQIVCAYLRGWFTIDFLSSIPMDPIFNAVMDDDIGGGSRKISGAETKLLKARFRVFAPYQNKCFANLHAMLY